MFKSTAAQSFRSPVAGIPPSIATRSWPSIWTTISAWIWCSPAPVASASSSRKTLNHFVDITSATRIPASVIKGSYTGAWAFDVDLDGDLDIVLGAANGDPIVLRNNGDSTFAVIKPFQGVDGLKAFSSADLNGDSAPASRDDRPRWRASYLRQREARTVSRARNARQSAAGHSKRLLPRQRRTAALWISFFSARMERSCACQTPRKSPGRLPCPRPC